MPTVYLALGTNLGQREANLRAAREALAFQVGLTAASRLYQTEPWGYTDQPAFLNQVLAAETSLPPLDLLDLLKQIETDLGRKATFRYGPRLIDLDLLLYDDLVLDTPRLTLPHPRMAERAFVLAPLAEIAPDLRHPVLGLTVRQLLEQVDASGVRPL